jgi:hypothetical protein
LSRGKLSVHEEFADAAVEAIAPFLRETFSNHISRLCSASALMLGQLLPLRRDAAVLVGSQDQ